MGAADPSENTRGSVVVVALSASQSSLVVFRPAARRRSGNPPCHQVKSHSLRAPSLPRLVAHRTHGFGTHTPARPQVAIPPSAMSTARHHAHDLPWPAAARTSDAPTRRLVYAMHSRRPSIWDYSASSSGRLAASSASSAVNLAMVASFSCSSGISSCSVTSSGSAWNGGGASNRNGTFSVSCP